MKCIMFELFSRRDHKMKTSLLAILVTACILQTGCDIINPKEDIPTYVHIDSFKFIPTLPGVTGTSRQSITSVWAYLDGQNLGVFDLPANIPVLVSKKSQLQLAAGISNQGLKDYQLIYPFFSFYNFDIESQPGKTINLLPETQYVADLKFWNEDFETGNTFQKLSGDTAIRRVTGADSVFEGGGAGCLTLDATYKTAESFAIINIKPGTESYLELHYKGTLPFQVGILVDASNYSYLAGVKPKDEWGKFYVNVQQYTTQFPNAQVISVLIKSSLEGEQTEGYLLLDNIKVISY